jgi:hypothetical protein
LRQSFQREKPRLICRRVRRLAPSNDYVSRSASQVRAKRPELCGDVRHEFRPNSIVRANGLILCKAAGKRIPPANKAQVVRAGLMHAPKRVSFTAQRFSARCDEMRFCKASPSLQMTASLVARSGRRPFRLVLPLVDCGRRACFRHAKLWLHAGKRLQFSSLSGGDS